MLKTVFRAALVLFALVLALLTALLLYLQFGDISAHRQRIEALVSDAAGRAFRIEGDMALNIWPELFLSVEGLRLANAEWGSEENMAGVGRFAIRIAPGSVLWGPVAVRDLQVQDVDLLVETGPGGESNWTLPVQEEPGDPADDAGGIAVLVERAQLSHLRLRYREPEREAQTVEIPSLSASGRLTGERGTGSLNLDAQGELASGLFAPLPAQPYAVSATLGIAEGQFSVEPLQIRLGDSDLSGTVRVNRGERVSAEARLQSQRIDLSQLVPDDGTRSGKAQENAKSAPETPPEAPTSQRYVFTEQPLPFELLQGNDIDLRWTADELVTPLVTLTATSLQAVLQNGKLEARSDFEGPEGGLGRNTLVLNTADRRAGLTLKNRVRDLRVNLASGDVGQVSDIPPLSLTLDLNASGTSPRELAAGSDGDLLITLGPGQLTNSVVETFSGDLLAQLFSALNPLAETQKHMAFECGIVAVALEDGEATLDPLAFQSEQLQVIAGGSVNLETEAIDIEFNTRPREGVGVSADMFVTPFVSLEGTLANPGVGLNESSTLLAGGAAVMTGGMSLLWKGLLDRAAGTVDHCEETFRNHSHPPLESP